MMNTQGKVQDSNKRNFLIRSGLFLAPLLYQQTSLILPSKIVLGTDSQANSYTGMWLRRTYAEASRRLNIPIEIVVAPLKRISFLIEQGSIDGEVARGPAYAAAHPEMIEIDVELTPVVFAIYSIKPLPGINNLQDLVNSRYKGVYRRDVVFCEELLKPLFPVNRLTTTSDAERSFALISANRADFTCEVSSNIANSRYSGGEYSKKIEKIFELSKQVVLRPYLAPKHAEFAKLLGATLKKIKQEGLIKSYQEQAAKELSSRPKILRNSLIPEKSSRDFIPKDGQMHSRTSMF
jgi:hypothetical protein